MSDEAKNIIRVACIYAASIIGAGFASGQEIMQFFSTYKTGGFYGVLLAGVLFGVIGCIVLSRVYDGRIRNYEEFIFPMFGWHIGWIIEIAVTLFMFCMYSIMVAGAADVLSETLGLPQRFAVLIMGIICMLFILTNIKGIAVLSSVVTPVLVAGIILSGIYIIIMKESPASAFPAYLSRITDNWFFSSLLYVSYNSIPAVMMMCSMFPYLKTRRTAAAAGILGGAVLSLAALVINTVISLFYPSAVEKEIPVMDILYSLSSPAGSLYALLLWLAMLISAVTSGFCFTDRISNSLKVSRKVLAFLLCAAAVPLSALGFSRLISLVYPVFGYLGLFMIIVMLITCITAQLYGRK
jgi:uncharacterized membrane protein YkvI